MIPTRTVLPAAALVLLVAAGWSMRPRPHNGDVPSRSTRETAARETQSEQEPRRELKPIIDSHSSEQVALSDYQRSHVEPTLRVLREIEGRALDRRDERLLAKVARERSKALAAAAGLPAAAPREAKGGEVQ